MSSESPREPLPISSDAPSGEPQIELEDALADGEPCINVYFFGVSDDEFLENRTSADQVNMGVLVARVTKHTLSMRPVHVNILQQDYLKPKYGPIEWIVFEAPGKWFLPSNVDEFEELLRSLPQGFARRAIYGLGLRWEYRHLMQAIAQIKDITEVRIVSGHAVRCSPPIYTLGIDRFDQLRRVFDRITARHRRDALEEKTLTAYSNLLGVVDKETFPLKVKKIRPGAIYELMTVGIKQKGLNAHDRRAAVSVVAQDVDEIAKTDFAELLSLRENIEKTTLKAIIEKMKGMLSRNLNESAWQNFFATNPFILSLAFAYPVFMVQSHAYVGGTTIRGAGEKVADFLFAQQFTGNLALIEIKRPGTDLLSSAYRPGVFGASKEVAGAMAQVLDQRFRLQRSFTEKAYESGLKDVHPFSIHCVIVAGLVPEQPEQRRSLELFRNASKDVHLVAFDELFRKLEAISLLLEGDTKADAADSLSEDELPF